MTHVATVPSIPPVEKLAEFELFADLPDNLLRQTHENASLLEVAPDETVLSEGQYER
ncbi:uncharacterized protein METZ01_LOCUS470235, partial [marine metagenome]